MVSTETLDMWCNRPASFANSRLSPREWCEYNDVILHQFYSGHSALTNDPSLIHQARNGSPLICANLSTASPPGQETMLFNEAKTQHVYIGRPAGTGQQPIRALDKAVCDRSKELAVREYSLRRMFERDHLQYCRNRQGERVKSIRVPNIPLRTTTQYKLQRSLKYWNFCCRGITSAGRDQEVVSSNFTISGQRHQKLDPLRMRVHI